MDVESLRRPQLAQCCIQLHIEPGCIAIIAASRLLTHTLPHFERHEYGSDRFDGVKTSDI